MWISVTGTDGARIAKYLDFEDRAAAVAHANEHGGAVYQAPAQGSVHDWRIDGASLVYDPPPPPRKSTLTYSEFRARFTEQEMAAIRQAVLRDAEALDWALDAASDNRINLDSSTTSAFLDKMVAAGIINASRKAEIIA